MGFAEGCSLLRAWAAICRARRTSSGAQQHGQSPSLPPSLPPAVFLEDEAKGNSENVFPSNSGNLRGFFCSASHCQMCRAVLAAAGEQLGAALGQRLPPSAPGWAAEPRENGFGQQPGHATSLAPRQGFHVQSGVCWLSPHLQISLWVAPQGSGSHPGAAGAWWMALGKGRGQQLRQPRVGQNVWHCPCKSFVEKKYNSSFFWNKIQYFYMK